MDFGLGALSGYSVWLLAPKEGC